MFETLDDRRQWGAIADLPITRGYATLGDGVLEFLDAQGVRCRLTFGADDLQARPSSAGAWLAWRLPGA